MENIPVVKHEEWTEDNGRNNLLRINGAGAPRAFNIEIVKEVEVTGDYEVIVKLGYAYYFLGDYHNSIFYLEKAIKLVTDDPKPYSILGMANYSIGQSQKAKNYLKKAKKIYLDSGNIKRAKEIGDLIEIFI